LEAQKGGMGAGVTTPRQIVSMLESNIQKASSKPLELSEIELVRRVFTPIKRDKKTFPTDETRHKEFWGKGYIPIAAEWKDVDGTVSMNGVTFIPWSFKAVYCSIDSIDGFAFVNRILHAVWNHQIAAPEGALYVVVPFKLAIDTDALNIMTQYLTRVLTYHHKQDGIVLVGHPKPEVLENVPVWATAFEGVTGLVIQGSNAFAVGENPERGAGMPGGAVEAGETLLDAFRREIKEEIQVDLDYTKPVMYLGGHSQVRVKDGTLSDTMYWFAAEMKEGQTPKATRESGKVHSVDVYTLNNAIITEFKGKAIDSLTFDGVKYGKNFCRAVYMYVMGKGTPVNVKGEKLEFGSFIIQ
jgi:ADP-ribose pyrophosphatase YjhB (NUDIX family)